MAGAGIGLYDSVILGGSGTSRPYWYWNTSVPWNGFQRDIPRPLHGIIRCL